MTHNNFAPLERLRLVCADNHFRSGGAVCFVMGRFIDHLGKQFGHWTVLRRAPNRRRPEGSLMTAWLCRCKCGNEVEVQTGNLTSGKSTQCMKCHCEMRYRTTHGESKNGTVSREYRAWSNMKRRCLDAKHPRFKDYGGRGIKVCDRWLADFSNFLADMGRCPPGMSLDRKDNDLGYCKDNCEWASAIDQTNNARSNIVVAIGVETHTVAEWCRILKRNPKTVYVRLHSGWNPVRALTQPNRQGNYGKLSKRKY